MISLSIFSIIIIILIWQRFLQHKLYIFTMYSTRDYSDFCLFIIRIHTTHLLYLDFLLILSQACHAAYYWKLFFIIE